VEINVNSKCRGTVQEPKCTQERIEGTLNQLAQADTLSTCIPELPGCNLDGNKDYVTKGFRGSPQTFHANAEY
jgi:hypothetical protein